MTKSGYFAKMFDGPFEEANAASVTVDEEPALFVRVIEFLYLNEYTGTTGSTDIPASGHGQFRGVKDIYRERHPIFLHIDLFHFADIFTITGLKQEAGKGFARHWFTTLHPGQQQNSPITFSDIDADVIKAVYEPPLTDSGLRDMVVLGQKSNMEVHQILTSMKYTNVIKAIPEFALDLIQKPLVRPQCRCFKCGSTQPVLWERCACGSWDDCGFYMCISKLVEKMQCYKCGQFGFSYSPSQPNLRTVHRRRPALGPGAPLQATYGGTGVNPYNLPTLYGNAMANGVGTGGAGGVGTGGAGGMALGGGIVGAYNQGVGVGAGAGAVAGYGGLPGVNTVLPPTLANPSQAHALTAGIRFPTPIGVATVSHWSNAEHSANILVAEQD